MKRSLTYLKRHLESYPVFDEETLEVVCWIFKGELMEMAKAIFGSEDNVVARSVGDEFHEWFSEAGVCAQILLKTFRGLKPLQRKRAERHLKDFIDARLGELSYRGCEEFEKSLDILREMFNLDDSETELCAFLYMISSFQPLAAFFINHLECHRLYGRRSLANALGIGKGELEKILGGTLRRIGLLEIDKQSLCMEEGFQDLLENPTHQIVSWHSTPLCGPGEVTLKDHFLPKEEIRYVLELLKERPKRSIHILLYGAPGTGKTTFAQCIAREINIPAYAIIRGEENTSQRKRAAIVACINMTNNGPAGSLIVVDEADNTLNTRHSWLSRGETQDKGWLNQILEEPGVRMIWITNRIDEIEESVLRRFAFSLHFRRFNSRQRRLLWENILRMNNANAFLGHNDTEDFAKNFDLGAGAIDLAVKGAVEAGRDSKEDFQEAVRLTLEAHQTLLNDGEKQRSRERVEKNYSLDGLHIEGDLKGMLDQLERFDRFLRAEGPGEGCQTNLLFYGPPGSGKSELGRYIAERLGREVISKRPSDILGAYVGQSEGNLKNAFEGAEREEAILIIDEAETFLFNRNRAERSWEISLTNEFLTQMERFRGILICTTNRLEDLDKASLRRFHSKIGFRYLTPEGKVTFYESFLCPLTNRPADPETLRTLREIPDLTPGDFKAVRDRFRFEDPQGLSHGILIGALGHESRLKKIHEGRAVVGF